MDPLVMKILAVVGTEQSENLCHRKGKGFLTMSISQELVSPNPPHSMRERERETG